MGSDPTDAFGAIRQRPWVSLLVLLVGLSTVLLAVLRARIGFFLDDWALIFYRDGWTDWLLPHNEHIIVIPAALYELSLGVFGMTAIPLHLLAVLLFELSVVLLFLWLRPLAGEPVSVLGCAVVLFLGASVADLIWAFQIGYFGSFAAGLGALLLLRLKQLRADLLACFLLVISLLFSSMAVPFAVAAAVQLLYRGSDRPDPASLIRRAWVVGVPALCFIGWWLGWGQHADSSISAANLLRMPLYVLSAFGYAAASLTGLFSLRVVTTSYLWAIPGLALASGLALLLRRRRRIPPEFLIAAAAGLAFWILSALNYIPGREFFSSRYQYPAVIFVLMILAGAFSPLRPDRRQLGFLKGLAAIAVVLNLAALIYGYDRYREIAEDNRAGFTGLDIAGPGTRPDFSVGISPDGEFKVSADDYFRTVERTGSAGWSERELERKPGPARERVDETLREALPVVLLPSRDVVPDRKSCRTVLADPEASAMVEVESEYLLIRATGTVLIKLKRFSSGVTAWAAPSARAVGYQIPKDSSGRQWQIGFEGEGKVTLCRASGRPVDRG